MATKTAKTPETLLAAANGRRRVRTLDITEVEELIAKVRAGENGHWARQNGGQADHSYECQTTIAFAAKVEGVVYLGISSANGRTKGTAGAAWAELRGLENASEAKQAGNLAAWVNANHKNVIEIYPYTFIREHETDTPKTAILSPAVLEEVERRKWNEPVVVADREGKLYVANLDEIAHWLDDESREYGHSDFDCSSAQLWIYQYCILYVNKEVHDAIECRVSKIEPENYEV